ncbi:hypothetical protein CLOM_g18039 [Closterium sp. NIES-68]|nr:hypothetical protein CLOM_g18039 [Closterium sp. NIES-68]
MEVLAVPNPCRSSVAGVYTVPSKARGVVSSAEASRLSSACNAGYCNVRVLPRSSRRPPCRLTSHSRAKPVCVRATYGPTGEQQPAPLAEDVAHSERQELVAHGEGAERRVTRRRAMAATLLALGVAASGADSSLADAVMDAVPFPVARGWNAGRMGSAAAAEAEEAPPKTEEEIDDEKEAERIEKLRLNEEKRKERIAVREEKRRIKIAEKEEKRRKKIEAREAKRGIKIRTKEERRKARIEEKEEKRRQKRAEAKAKRLKKEQAQRERMLKKQEEGGFWNRITG